MTRRQSCGAIVDDAAAPADADIVVEAVEPAELRDRGVDHRAGLLFVGDVGDEGAAVPPSACDHRDGALGPLAIEIDDEHLGAGAGEQDRRRTAIADAVIRRPATGDDRHLAGEAEPSRRSLLRHRPSPRPSPLPLTLPLGPPSPAMRERGLPSSPPRLRERVGVRGDDPALRRCRAARATSRAFPAPGGRSS